MSDKNDGEKHSESPKRLEGRSNTGVSFADSYISSEEVHVDVPSTPQENITTADPPRAAVAYSGYNSDAESPASIKSPISPGEVQRNPSSNNTVHSRRGGLKSRLTSTTSLDLIGLAALGIDVHMYDGDAEIGGEEVEEEVVEKEEEVEKEESEKKEEGGEEKKEKKVKVPNFDIELDVEEEAGSGTAKAVLPLKAIRAASLFRHRLTAIRARLAASERRHRSHLSAQLPRSVSEITALVRRDTLQGSESSDSDDSFDDDDDDDVDDADEEDVDQPGKGVAIRVPPLVLQQQDSVAVSLEGVEMTPVAQQQGTPKTPDTPLSLQSSPKGKGVTVAPEGVDEGVSQSEGVFRRRKGVEGSAETKGPDRRYHFQNRVYTKRRFHNVLLQALDEEWREIDKDRKRKERGARKKAKVAGAESMMSPRSKRKSVERRRSRHPCKEAMANIFRPVKALITGTVPMLSKIVPLQWAIDRIAAYYGGGVASWFEFMRVLILLNVGMVLIWFPLVILPFLAQPPPSYQLLTDIHQIKGLAGLRGLEYTFLYYGGYELYDTSTLTNSSGTFYYVNTTVEHHYWKNWDLPLSYTLSVLFALAFSVLLVVVMIGRRIGFSSAERQLVRSDEFNFPYNTVLFTGIDFSIRSKTAMRDMRNAMGLAFIDILEKDKIKEEQTRRLQRSEWCKTLSFRLLGLFLTLLVLGGSAVAIYYLAQNQEELNDSFPYAVSLAVAGMNIFFPFIIQKIVLVERWVSVDTIVRQQLFRMFALRIFNVVFLIFNLYNLRGNQVVPTEDDGTDIHFFDPDTICLQTQIGQQFWRLIVTDFAVSLITTYTTDYLLQKLIRRGSAEFNLPKNTMDVIYRQMLIWIGSATSPMIPALGVVVNLITFYLKYPMIYHNFRPPTRLYSAARSSAFNYFLLLVALAASIVPSVWFLVQDHPQCGPHQPSSGVSVPFDVITDAIDSAPNVIRDVLTWVLNIATLAGVCVILAVSLYFLWKKHRKLSRKRKLLERALEMEREDKIELLRAVGAEL